MYVIKATVWLFLLVVLVTCSPNTNHTAVDESIANLPVKELRKPLLIIMDGQSNNGGHGLVTELPDYLKSFHSNRVKIWNGKEVATLKPGSNNNGQMLLSVGGSWKKDWFGSELELSYRLQEHFTTSEIYFVKTGQGGKALGMDAKHPDFSVESVNELHSYLIANVKAFLNAENSNINDYEVWYLWGQGERDARPYNTDKANAYKHNLERKLQAIQTDLHLKEMHTIITVINSRIFSDTTNIAAVRGAQIAVAKASDNRFYILSENWDRDADKLHFSTTGQLAKATAEYQIISKYYK